MASHCLGEWLRPASMRASRHRLRCRSRRPKAQGCLRPLNLIKEPLLKVPIMPWAPVRVTAQPGFSCAVVGAKARTVRLHRFQRYCLASPARRIAPPHAGDDVGVAFKLGDVDFTAPIKPREALLAVSCRGSNVDPFIFRPSALLPKPLALKNEQVVIVVRHDAPPPRLCLTMQVYTWRAGFVIPGIFIKSRKSFCEARGSARRNKYRSQGWR